MTAKQAYQSLDAIVKHVDAAKKLAHELSEVQSTNGDQALAFQDAMVSNLHAVHGYANDFRAYVDLTKTKNRK
jgi:hypothetical protein